MKIDSYKVIKYIFYILCIISLFFSIKRNVNALEVDSYWLTTNDSSWSGDVGSSYSTTYSNTNGIKYIELTPNNIGLKGGDYLLVNASLFMTTTSDNNTINLNNINLTETCTSHTDYGTTYGNNGRIVYADGTTAQIDYSQRTFLCNQWSEIGSQSGSYNISLHEKPILSVGLMFQNQNGSYNTFWCENLGGSSYKCDIPSGWTFSKITFMSILSGSNASYKLQVLRNMSITKSDTQTIINNNNQNTNTINNSIQDTNNTLKDDNVNGNNSNDTISSIGNTFDTENDFLLGLLTVPYNFFNSLINIFENNCTSLNVGSMFGQDLVFPCLSLSNLLGNVFTNVIDVIFCGVIMSSFLRRIVKYYQALLSLDERATQIGGVKIW